MLKKLATMALLATTLTLVPTNVFASTTTDNWPDEHSTTIDQMAGNTKYETARLVAEKLQPNHASNIVIATGLNFADSLSATVFAHEKQAPILLVDSAVSKSLEAFSYIKSHCDGSTNVYIIGGSGIIPDEFISQLNSLGISNVTRMGGIDRYDTSKIIASAENIKQGTKVALCYGMNYPDALSIASFAANLNYPILLTDSKELSSEATSVLQQCNPTEVFVVGGTGVITPNVQSEIQNLIPSATITRFAGADRYDTNIQVIKHFTSTPTNVYYATGEDYSDALVGSTLSSVHGDPIVLLNTTTLKQNPNTSDYCAQNRQAVIASFGNVDYTCVRMARVFTSDVQQNPTGQITKSQLAEMLVNAYFSSNYSTAGTHSLDKLLYEGTLNGSKVLSSVRCPSFSDTQKDSDKLAFILGVADEQNGQFSPNCLLNREQAAGMFANDFQSIGSANMNYTSNGVHVASNHYSDASSIDPSYIYAADLCFNHRVMMPQNGEFNPNGVFTVQDAINEISNNPGRFFPIYGVISLRGKVAEDSALLNLNWAVGDDYVTVDVPSDNTPQTSELIQSFQAVTNTAIIPTGQQALLGSVVGLSVGGISSGDDKISALTSSSVFDGGFQTITTTVGATDNVKFQFKSSVPAYVGGQYSNSLSYGDPRQGVTLNRIN